jgi:hypothetical protein
MQKLYNMLGSYFRQKENNTTQPNTNDCDPQIDLNQTNVKIHMQNKLMVNDMNDLNMFIKYRGTLFNSAIVSNVCATLGFSTLALYNVAPNMVSSFNLSNRAKLLPMGMFVIGGSLSMLANQVDGNLEANQKKLLNKYNINTEYYIDQRGIDLYTLSGPQLDLIKQYIKLN